jgi:hypothetical protein
MKKIIKAVGAVLILMAFISLIVAGGCSGQKKSKSGQNDPFSINDSLIGSEYKITGTGKSICPPINYAPAPDSVIKMLRASFEKGSGVIPGVTLVQCFLDTSHISGLLVTVIDSLNLGADTAKFMEWYRQSLVNLFGPQNVHESNALIGDISLKSFLAIDSLNFRYQFVCLTQTGNAVELNYFGPRIFYPTLMRSLESSVGSIKSTETH